MKKWIVRLEIIDPGWSIKDGTTLHKTRDDIRGIFTELDDLNTNLEVTAVQVFDPDKMRETI